MNAIKQDTKDGAIAIIGTAAGERDGQFELTPEEAAKVIGEVTVERKAQSIRI